MKYEWASIITLDSRFFIWHKNDSIKWVKPDKMYLISQIELNNNFYCIITSCNEKKLKCFDYEGKENNIIGQINAKSYKGINHISCTSHEINDDSGICCITKEDLRTECFDFNILNKNVKELLNYSESNLVNLYNKNYKFKTRKIEHYNETYIDCVTSPDKNDCCRINYNEEINNDKIDNANISSARVNQRRIVYDNSYSDFESQRRGQIANNTNINLSEIESKHYYTCQESSKIQSIKNNLICTISIYDQANCIEFYKNKKTYLNLPLEIVYNLKYIEAYQLIDIINNNNNTDNYSLKRICYIDLNNSFNCYNPIIYEDINKIPEKYHKLIRFEQKIYKDNLNHIQNVIDMAGWKESYCILNLDLKVICRNFSNAPYIYDELINNISKENEYKIKLEKYYDKLGYIKV